MNVHDAKLLLTNVEKFAAQTMGFECDDRRVWSKFAMLKKEDGGYATVFAGPKVRSFLDFADALTFMKKFS